MTKFDPSEIPFDVIPPWLEKLLRRLQELEEEVIRLKEEIAELKKQKKRPKIAPSAIEQPKRARDTDRKTRDGQPLLGQRKAKQQTRVIQPDYVPEGSRFQGYQDYTIQELTIQATELTFRCAVWKTPDGKLIRGKLPSQYEGHYGPELITHILQLYHGGGMTQPALLAYLQEQGIKISAGQLDNLLIGNSVPFIEEMESLREAGLQESSHLHADDTGARHQGKNGVCTCISSPYFTYFKSSKSKSRLNFLQMLRGSYQDHVLDEAALNYAFELGVSDPSLEKLEALITDTHSKRFRSGKTWAHFLKKHKIRTKRDIRILSEATTLSSAIFHGLPTDIPIVSDAAGQFDILFIHFYCWIHEERHYRKYIPVTNQERIELNNIRSAIWDLYRTLKDFSQNPSTTNRQAICTQFDTLFNRSGLSEGLDSLLKNTYSRKKGLLQVLNHPDVPLHNNDCERDIRVYVKRRKASGTTRSDAGRQARDAFLSLYKSCAKLDVSFFGYIRDRILQLGEIPPLAHRLIHLARASP